MSDPQDQKLDSMLRSRRFEPPSADLPQRIALAALRVRPAPVPSLGAWLRQLFAEFRLPRPAYVIAATLLLGFLVGLSEPFEGGSSSGSSPTSSAAASDDTDAMYVQSFLYGDEDPS